MRGEAARTGRIVVDRDRLGEDLLAELVLEETGLAGDRRAADGAGEAADQAGRDARIVNDGAAAGRNLLRIEPAHRTASRLAADLARALHVGAMGLGVGVVVALHRGALAG